MTNKQLLALLAASLSTGAVAFAPPSLRQTRPPARASTAELALGIPKFLLPDNDDDDDAKKNGGKSDKKKDDDDKKVGLSGLFQLITAGAGAPFLGDYQGIDEETGNFMFTLEANNLVDENGNSKQTQATYFENGWVDENDPGFQWPWEKKKE